MMTRRYGARWEEVAGSGSHLQTLALYAARTRRFSLAVSTLRSAMNPLMPNPTIDWKTY